MKNKTKAKVKEHRANEKKNNLKWMGDNWKGKKEEVDDNEEEEEKEEEEEQQQRQECKSLINEKVWRRLNELQEWLDK